MDEVGDIEYVEQVDLESESSSGSDSEDDDEVNPTWSAGTSGLKDIPFTGDSGLLVPIPGNNKPFDWFTLMLDVIFLERIVIETNRYALEFFCGPATTLKSRIANWKDIMSSNSRFLLD